MRKLIYFSMASLDGYLETPERSLDWVIIDAELHRHVNNLEGEAGAYLYGRRMYELMNAYWPTADTQSDQAEEVEFARIWQRVPKLVFSSTLERVEGNAQLVREDPVAEVTRLKEEPGGHLEVGGAQLASSLIRAGLVDEYRIYLNPVILGAGTPIFPALEERVRLQLVETHTFSSGVVFLRYERRV